MQDRRLVTPTLMAESGLAALGRSGTISDVLTTEPLGVNEMRIDDRRRRVADVQKKDGLVPRCTPR